MYQILQTGKRGGLLAKMRGAKIPTEAGFFISSEAFAAFVDENDIRQELLTAVRGIHLNSPKDLQSAAKKMRRIILHGEFPQDSADQILSTYVGLGEPRVALFPSLVTTDAEDPLHTTIEDSFFGFKGDANLFEGIRDVWAHFFDPKPLFYRLKHERDHFSLPFAICVQVQPEYRITGIVYTDDPTSHTKQTSLVKAVFGEGALTQEIDGADYYWIQRGGGNVYNSMFDTQKRQLFFENGEKKMRIVPKTTQEKRKLTDEQLGELGRIAKNIQQEFFYPQRCVFAIRGRDIKILHVEPFSEIDVPHLKTKPTIAATTMRASTNTQSAYPLIIGLEYGLTSAGHLPEFSTLKGHLCIQTKHFLNAYPDDIEGRKRKLFTHELIHALSFAITHCAAHLGFLYLIPPATESPTKNSAQLEALLAIKREFPNLPLTLVGECRNLDTFTRDAAIWEKNGLHRGSHLHYAICIRTPAQLYEVEEYVAIGAEAILIDLDQITSALHAGDVETGQSKAVLDFVKRAKEIALNSGIGCIILSSKIPSHAMLDIMKTQSLTEWIATTTTYLSVQSVE